MLCLCEIPQDASLIRINSTLTNQWTLGTSGYVGINTLTSDVPLFPKSVFYTLNIRKAPNPKPHYLLAEGGITTKYGWKEDYTHFRDYAGSFYVKGALRISQSLNLKHKAPIDIMIFLDKKSAQVLDTTHILLQSPYQNDTFNHRLVKEILGEEQFNKFILHRFNYAYAGIEGRIDSMDGEWSIKNPVCALVADYFISFYQDIYHTLGIVEDSLMLGGLSVATLRDFKVLDSLPEISEIEDALYDTALGYPDLLIKKAFTTKHNFKSPIVKGVFAQTLTDENDFVVNVRDKPTKHSKIIAQLYSQRFRPREEHIRWQQAIEAGESHRYDAWRKAQIKAQKEYFIKNKDSLINPFYDYTQNPCLLPSKDYIIFISDIVEGDWAKVRVLKYAYELRPRFTWYDYMDEYETEKREKYKNTFLNNISTITLHQGYIHTSSLDPYTVFPR